MRLTITTTYSNVDEEWLDWYMKRLLNQEVLPGSTKIVAELKKTGKASFESKDPNSDVMAKTTYLVEIE